jgi:hypothetical protein
MGTNHIKNKVQRKDVKADFTQFPSSIMAEAVKVYGHFNGIPHDAETAGTDVFRASILFNSIPCLVLLEFLAIVDCWVSSLVCLMCIIILVDM